MARYELEKDPAAELGRYYVKVGDQTIGTVGHLAANGWLARLKDASGPLPEGYATKEEAAEALLRAAAR